MIDEQIPERFYTMFSEILELLAGDEEISPSQRLKLRVVAVREAMQLFSRQEAAQIIAKQLRENEAHQKWTYNEHYAPNIEKQLESIAGGIGDNSIMDPTGENPLAQIADKIDILGYALEDVADAVKEVAPKKAKAPEPKAPPAGGPLMPGRREPGRMKT